MGILIDVILVAIIALNVFMGYKKGLVNAVFSICAFLIAIVLTLILYKPVSNIIINNTEIVPKIESVIINNNSSEEIEDSSNENETGLQLYVNNIAGNAKEHSMEIVAETVAKKAVEVITAIVLFIIIRILVILLKFLTESIASLPIIRQFNHAGGLLYGILKALVIIYVILTILFLVVSINGEGIIANAIDSSFITKFLYENNIIVKYVNHF
jgi:uncharacterized membrane protein required for colicin V production